MSKTRLAKIVLTIKGVWSPTVEYEKLDVVNYLGSSYIAKRDNIGVTPVEGDDWSLSAEKGDKGDKGDQGDKIYLHIAYANSEDGETDFTTSPVSDKVYTYLGSYSDYTPEDPNVPSTYVWSKLSEEAARAAAELLRVAAEEERVAAETSRVSAESQRDSAESARNTAEETRVSNEQSRVSAEINRVSGESARQSAETARVSSETDRQEAEVSRVDEEKRRVSAETDRVNAETNRIEGEQHRVSAEQSRSDAETVRVNNESARKIAEETRVSDESARKTAETSRVSAENKRDTSETKRVNAETSRATAEAARVNAEDERVLAEQERVSAESGRVSAEQGRVSAETERVTAETERAATFSGYQNEINQFKNDIVTSKDAATENTKFAIGTAEQTLEVPSMEEITQLKGDVAAITPDDTAVDGKPWTSKKIVDSLCQPFEESGNPVQVYPVEGYPLGVKVSWEPTQAGEGDPSPENIRPISGRNAVSVIRCGKNLWNLGNMELNQYKELSAYFPSGNYVFTGNVDTEASSETVQIGIKIDNVWKYIQKDKNKRFIINITANNSITGFRLYAGASPEYKEKATYSNIQLELGSTATPYEPYTGDTYNIALPETVYGGEVDAVSGEGQETWGFVTLDGTEGWTVSGKFLDNKTDWYYLSSKIPNAVDAAPNKGNEICSHYPHADVSNTNTVQGCAIVWGAIRVRWGDTIPDDADAWKAYLAAQNAAGTPVQIAYKLAEPVTFTATGTQPIPALSGVNTLYTDSGDISVSGRTDMIWLTQSLIDRIAALETAAVSE